MEKKSETTTKENPKEENSVSSNNRRRRRVRRGEEVASQKKAEENKEDKKDSEDKKEVVKNERRRGEKTAKKVEDEENFVGISSSDYFKQLNNLVDAYSGKSNQIIDVRSKLSGRNLAIYNETYKPYDVNGNQKLKKHNIQFKNQLIRRIDLKEKVNLPFLDQIKKLQNSF